LSDVRGKNEKLAFQLVVDPQHVEVISKSTGKDSNKAEEENPDDIMQSFEGFFAKENR